MKKIVILNVGGALSSYGEFENQKFLIDLGNNSDFSPIDNFLEPLFIRNKIKKIEYGKGEGKYYIDQLFLSHLDKDHIADYEKFKNKFHPNYMTCPSDNSKMNDKFKINRDKIGELTDLKKLVLDDMQNRKPEHYDRPLVSIIDNIQLNFIYPKECEEIIELSDGYANNISLVLFAKVGSKTVLFPGDLLKKGMKYLIDNNKNFKSLLEDNGVDYLVAPHHGLQTSFSEYFFQTIQGNKTRLNIISEKVRSEDSEENRRPVDTRYYHKDYSTGDNSLNRKGVKTSLGHIVIDFETPDNEVKQYSDINDVINEFVS